MPSPKVSSVMPDYERRTIRDDLRKREITHSPGQRLVLVVILDFRDRGERNLDYLSV